MLISIEMNFPLITAACFQIYAHVSLLRLHELQSCPQGDYLVHNSFPFIRIWNVIVGDGSYVQQMILSFILSNQVSQLS